MLATGLRYFWRAARNFPIAYIGDAVVFFSIFFYSLVTSDTCERMACGIFHAALTPLSSDAKSIFGQLALMQCRCV